MTTRYFVFAGEGYYPCGGLEDYQGSTTTIAEAKALVERGKIEEPQGGYDPGFQPHDWGHIGKLDPVTGELVIVWKYSWIRFPPKRGKARHDWIRDGKYPAVLASRPQACRAPKKKPKARGRGPSNLSWRSLRRGG